MVDLLNVLLRAVMCIAFIMWVVRPMLMTFSRRELDHAEIEEAAQMAITSAFQAYSNKNTNYYDNPQLAVYMAQNPDLHIPSDEEMAQRQKAALEQAQADEAAAQLAAANPAAEVVATEGPTGEVSASAETDPNATTVAQQLPVEGIPADATAVAVVEGAEGDDEGESLAQMRERVKLENKQKKPTIPPELLQNANSYEDQLMVVRMIVDQEQSRVASVIRNMIQVK